MSIDILIRKHVPRFFRVIFSLPVLELLKLTGGASRQGKRKIQYMVVSKKNIPQCKLQILDAKIKSVKKFKYVEM